MNDKNSSAEADPPIIAKLGPVKTPNKYKQAEGSNKTKGSTEGAVKPAPKVEKKEDKASNDDLNRKKQEKQSMV